MALGTITNVIADPHSNTQAVPIRIGDVSVTVTTVVGDGNYPTGGTALTAAQLGLSSTVLFAVCTVAGSAANNGGSNATYNLSTGKLQVFVLTTGALAEVVNTGNLSGLTITIVAFGY